MPLGSFGDSQARNRLTTCRFAHCPTLPAREHPRLPPPFLQVPGRGRGLPLPPPPPRRPRPHLMPHPPWTTPPRLPLHSLCAPVPVRPGSPPPKTGCRSKPRRCDPLRSYHSKLDADPRVRRQPSLSSCCLTAALDPCGSAAAVQHRVRAPD